MTYTKEYLCGLIKVECETQKEKFLRLGLDPESFENFQRKEDFFERNFDCFIATAVYDGNPNAPQVQTLRDFRDDYLMPNPLGRRIVDFYYSGVGERGAEILRENLPSTIPIIREGLDFLVSFLPKKGGK